MAEKVRVHTLAKALNVTSKDILKKCQAEGIDVKNHMSTLTAGLEATVREWFGEPYKVAQHRGAHPSDIAYYRRAEGTMDGGEGRVLAVELTGDIVTGWLFDSSMEEDSTAFSAARRGELETGVSSSDEVLQQLGEPSGRCRVPSNLAVQHLEDPLPPDAAEVWLWRHTVIDRNLIFLRSKTRILGCAFDAEGRLAQLEYRGPDE